MKKSDEMLRMLDDFVVGLESAPDAKAAAYKGLAQGRCGRKAE
jgi:hypothetical protein